MGDPLVLSECTLKVKSIGNLTANREIGPENGISPVSVLHRWSKRKENRIKI